MTAEEYLRQAATIDMEIKVNREMIEEEIDAVTRVKGVDYSKEKLQGGNRADICERLAEVYDNTEAKQKRIRELAKLKIEIREVIEGLNDGLERTIMYRKFFRGQTNEEIAEILGVISVKTIKRHYHRALKRLDCKLKRLGRI